MKRVILRTAILLVLAVAACAPAPMPAPTIALLTPTSLPSPTSILTPTPIPPTPTFTPSPTATPTLTPTPLPTPTLTETPTPLPTFTLAGVVFFDYNGNGMHDPHEPPTPEATVQVGSLVATSGEDGSYVLEGVPAGNRQVRLSAEGFRYISLSLEAFQAIEEPVSVVVDGDFRRDWGLMEGFLTLPFRCETQYRISNYFDLNPTNCPGVDPHQCPKIRDWQGGKQTYDGHGGIDYVMPERTPILAAAGGVIVNTGYDDRAGNYVVIEHDNGGLTRYHHLAYISALKGQRVVRGQRGGLSGNTGDSSEPHLHFELRIRGMHTDPYRDLSAPNSKGYWTKDNDPQCVE